MTFGGGCGTRFLLDVGGAVMGQKSKELFLLSGSTPLGGWGHGSGVLTGHAQAESSFRRGMKLDAEVDVQGRLEGTVGHDLAATLRAGVDVRAAAVIQAQIPLDLFTEAGLVARADLAVAASAFVSLQLSLRLHELEQMVHDQLPGPGGDLVAILLDEFQLSAGLWAKAAFAAELHAQAVLAGSLVGDNPGFTFSFEAAAGIGASAGVSFLLNAGFADPDALVRRLASRLAEAVTDLLPEATPAERRIKAAVHIVLPGLLGATLTAGRQLATARTEETARALAGGAMMGSAISRSIEVLFKAALDIAFDELRAVLNDSPIVAAMATVTDKPAALDAVGRLGAALSALDDPACTAPPRLFEAVLGVVGAVEDLITLPGLPTDIGESVTPKLATLWATAAIIDGVVANATATGSSPASLLNGAPSADPGARLRQVYGGEVTYRRLVTFLADEVDRLLESDPDLAPVVHLVGELIGAGDGVVPALLSLAGSPPGEIEHEVVTTLLTVGGHLLVEDVMSSVEQATHDVSSDVRVLLDDFVRPVLVSVGRMMPEVLSDLSDSDQRMRAREGLSAVVLCLLGSGITTLIELVVQHASANGPSAAEGLASDVRGAGAGSQAYRQLAAAGQGGSVSPDSVARTLDRVKAITPRVGGDKMRQLIDGLGGTFRAVGSSTSAGEVAAILHSDDVPPGVDVGRVVSDSAGRALAMAGDLFVEMFEEIGRAIAQLAEVVVHALDQAAHAVIEVLRSGVALAEKAMHEIADAIDKLGRDIDRYLGDVLEAAARLARALQAAADHFFDGLLTALDQALHSTLPGPIADAVFGTVRQILRGVQEIIDMFADIVTAVAEALAARLHAAANSGQLSEGMFDGHVNAVAYAAPRHDVHFDIPTFWGSIPVTIDAGSVAGAALSSLTGTGAYAPARRQAVDGVAALAGARSARNQAQAAYDSAATRTGMADRIAGLQTGRAVEVAIEKPGAGSVNGAQAAARVRVGGANRSFVQDQTSFGMPNRIKIIVNGIEVAAPGLDWVEDSDDLVWDVDLVSVVPVVPAAQPAPVKRISSTTLVPNEARSSIRVEETAVVTVSVSERPRLKNGYVPAFDVPNVVPRSSHELRATPWHAAVVVHPGVNTLAVVVADGSGQTAHASVVFVMGAPEGPSGPLRIVGVAYDPPEGEHIVLENLSSIPVDLSGWMIRDTARHRLRLPSRMAPPSARMRVFTGAGRSAGTDVYLGRRASVWNNEGDTAVLVNPQGELVSSFSYVGRAQ